MMKRTLLYLLKFAAGCMGLFWLVLMNHRALGIRGGGAFLLSEDTGTIVIELCVAALSLYLIVQLGLYAITLRKQPSPTVVTFLEKGIVCSCRDLYRRLLSPRQQQLFSLSAWSVFIYSLVALLISIDVFDTSEMYLVNAWQVRNLLRERSYGKSERGEVPTTGIADEPVRYFLFATEDNDIRKYYRDLHTIVRDLKAAGAKVIVADIPDVPPIGGIYGGIRPGLAALSAPIDSLGIVVWTQELEPFSYLSYPPHERLQLDTARVHPISSVIKEYAYTTLYPLMRTVVRWHPLRMYEATSAEYFPDAALMAARKFFDIPDTCALTTDGTHVSVGDVTIPVTSAGIAYADNLRPGFFNYSVIACRGVVVADGYEPHPDSLHYIPQYHPGDASWKPPTGPIRDLMEYRHFYEGKAVVINWIPNNQELALLNKVPEASVLSSVLRRSFYTRVDPLTHMLTLLSIVIIALVSAVVRRSGWIIVSAVVLAAGIVGFAVWGVMAIYIIFEPVYPVLACAISCIIFLLLKLSRDAQTM